MSQRGNQAESKIGDPSPFSETLRMWDSASPATGPEGAGEAEFLTIRSGFLQHEVFASRAVMEWLAEANLADLDGLHTIRGQCLNRRPHRVVWICELPDATGALRKLYIKLSHGRRRLIPRSTDLRSGQTLQSLAVREWRGIGLLQQLGMHVPRRMALLDRGWLYYRTAVVLESVPPQDSVDMLLQQNRWQPLPRADRTALLEGMVQTVVRIHTAGLGWRGASSRHFYPERQPAGDWRLWLIDCEGVHRASSPAVLQRYLNKLIRSMVESGADDNTMTQLRQLADEAMAAFTGPARRADSWNPKTNQRAARRRA